METVWGVSGNSKMGAVFFYRLDLIHLFKMCPSICSLWGVLDGKCSLGTQTCAAHTAHAQIRVVSGHGHQKKIMAGVASLADDVELTEMCSAISNT